MSERALVWLSGTEPVEEMARAVVETSEGDRSRYVDEHTGADVLTSTLSDGFDLRLNPYERATVDDPRDASFEGSVGIGTSLSFDGDEISAEVVLAYEEAADADTDDLEAYVEATRSTSFKDVYDLSFSTSGRAAVVTGKMNPEFMSLYLD
ncbi:hypothetical protein BRC64_09465 [Halobacteriales archaeon QH_10_67_22]|nr:MAG: hypothetical protein BRC64_09465 [Halobacteriales archaeon QH_10_67_22]